MYPDARVAEFVEQNFIPIRVHAREQRDAFKQLGKFTFEGTVEQARIDGPALWFIGKGTIKLSNGSGPPELHTHFAYVLVRQNQEWKAQLVSVGPDAPAPPNAPPANR